MDTETVVFKITIRSRSDQFTHATLNIQRKSDHEYLLAKMTQQVIKNA